MQVHGSQPSEKARARIPHTERNLEPGAQYGYWSLIRFARFSATKQPYWLARCICGKEKEVSFKHMLYGHSTNCGCMRSYNQTHGRVNTPEWRSWQNAKTRCYNPNRATDKWYHGRHIKMCEEWRNSFEQFLKDMGQRPTGTTLDRIDPNGNYEPGNCRWLSPKEQSRNTRRNVYVTWNGRKMCAREFADEIKANYWTLIKMLKRGMSAVEVHQRMTAL
jgi:hypothetical protein